MHFVMLSAFCNVI